MTTFLLSVLPLLSVLGAFLYAVVTGMRMYRSHGQLAPIAVAVALAGFTVGRLLDRFAALPTGLDDWVNYRDEVHNQVVTKGERILAVLSVEVALLFVFAAVIGYLAVVLVRRDSSVQAGGARRPRGLVLLSAVFVFAVGVTMRSKVAAGVAFLMAKAHLL